MAAPGKPRARGIASLGLGVCAAVGAALSVGDRAAATGAGLLVVLAGGALLWRGPAGRLLPGAVVAAAGFFLIAGQSAANVGLFGLVVLAGLLVTVGGGRESIAYVAAVLLACGVEAAARPDGGWAAWAGGTLFGAGSQWAYRRQRELTAALHEAQAGLAERAAEQERNRIARDLHDVIAHSLTVSLLHVSGARLALEHDPADAARAIAEAERLGRESLAEVRAAVGLLRTGDGAGTAPLPGVAAIPGLVEGFRSAGASVALHTTGDLDRLGPVAGLTVYRITQEALTNAARHAPGADVAVTIDAGPGDVRLAVDSAGRPRSDASGAGMGTRGMRERAAAVGGVCTAGAGGRGWLVTARLPLHGGSGP